MPKQCRGRRMCESPSSRDTRCTAGAARARSRHGSRSAAARPTKLCATTVQLVHTVCPVTPGSVLNWAYPTRRHSKRRTENPVGPQNIHTHQPRLPTTQPLDKIAPRGFSHVNVNSSPIQRSLCVRSLKRRRGPFSDLLKSGHMGKGATQHVVETRKPKAIDVPPELVSWMNPIGSFSDELVRACAARSESPRACRPVLALTLTCPPRHARRSSSAPVLQIASEYHWATDRWPVWGGHRLSTAVGHLKRGSADQGEDAHLPRQPSIIRLSAKPQSYGRPRARLHAG